MRRSEQEASDTRRFIMQLHRPVKLKLRRTIFLYFPPPACPILGPAGFLCVERSERDGPLQ